MINPRVVRKTIESANLCGNETVVEIGPGMGVLTEALLAHAGHVIAIEKDKRLFRLLSGKFKNAQNFELIYGDALKIPPPSGPFKLVANIPYYITSPLLDHFIRENTQNLPQCAVLLVQKEVAQKICAVPPHMNVLALHVQTFGDPKIVAKVSRANFSPQPKVDSSIIKINFPPVVSKINYKKYFDLIHCAFSQKRKMLRATLDTAALNCAGIDPSRRPETLSKKEWMLLAKNASF